jgi:arylsulfatase A
MTIPYFLMAAMAAPPNIVLVLADDLGVNDLGCYGRKEHLTPRLDRLAAEGFRFEGAYAGAPVCSPSRAAILTGKAPARLHLTTFLPGRADAPSQKLLHPKIRMGLPLEEETLAERLKRAGYATACLGKWHLGGKGFGPGDQGFEVAAAGSPRSRPSETEGGKGEYGLTERAEGFIEANREKPFFLYLAHDTPHIPLGAQAPRIEANRETFHPVYAAMMETLDDCVGRIDDRLRALGLAERTVFIFTSDNGGLHVPELAEDPPTRNDPFRAGKGFLYEGGLRVPLIVRWPGRIPAGRTLREPVIHMDLVPTILELAGLPAAEGLDGASFAAALTGGTAPEAPTVPEGSEGRALFWHFPHYTNQGSRPGGAILEGRWKLIEHYEDGRAELFDLSADPGESNDLSGSRPDRARAMREKLAAWRRSVGAQENGTNPAFDAGRHREIYIDVDVSRLRPAARASEMTPALAAWRRAIDAAVRPAAAVKSGAPAPAAAPAQASPPAQTPVPLVPEIDGPWWRIAGKPDLGPLGKPEQEPVDFTVWRAADRTWQLWSCIRKTREEGHTRLFYRWEGPGIDRPDWKPMGIAMRADPRRGEQPGGLQAPHVFRDGERYLMAYGDWQRICLASGADGKAFAPIPDASGSPALFGEVPAANARDPMVIRVGSLWHCYYTGAPEGKGAVFARTSPDLRTWGPRIKVHSGGRGGDGPWSAECPHVVERGGHFYLFRTQFYGKGNVSHVYRSRDPLDFGEGDAGWAASLPVAAPEIVADGDRDSIAALEPGLDGIRVARLRWVPAEGGSR